MTGPQVSNLCSSIDEKQQYRILVRPKWDLDVQQTVSLVVEQ
jgi:hypothetical protein